MPNPTSSKDQSMSSYTPGPWEVRWSQPDPLDIETAVKDGKRSLIASAWVGLRYRVSPERAEANARLIAAAPELLEALKELRKLCDKASIPLVNSHAVRDMGKFMKACDAADLAIRKAEVGDK